MPYSEVLSSYQFAEIPSDVLLTTKPSIEFPVFILGEYQPTYVTITGTPRTKNPIPILAEIADKVAIMCAAHNTIALSIHVNTQVHNIVDDAERINMDVVHAGNRGIACDVLRTYMWMASVLCVRGSKNANNLAKQAENIWSHTKPMVYASNHWRSADCLIDDVHNVLEGNDAWTNVATSAQASTINADDITPVYGHANVYACIANSNAPQTEIATLSDAVALATTLCASYAVAATYCFLRESKKQYQSMIAAFTPLQAAIGQRVTESLKKVCKTRGNATGSYTWHQTNGFVSHYFVNESVIYAATPSIVLTRNNRSTSEATVALRVTHDGNAPSCKAHAMLNATIMAANLNTTVIAVAQVLTVPNNIPRIKDEQLTPAKSAKTEVKADAYKALAKKIIDLHVRSAISGELVPDKPNAYIDDYAHIYYNSLFGNSKLTTIYVVVQDGIIEYEPHCASQNILTHNAVDKEYTDEGCMKWPASGAVPWMFPIRGKQTTANQFEITYACSDECTVPPSHYNEHLWNPDTCTLTINTTDFDAFDLAPNFELDDYIVAVPLQTCARYTMATCCTQHPSVHARARTFTWLPRYVHEWNPISNIQEDNSDENVDIDDVEFDEFEDFVNEDGKSPSSDDELDGNGKLPFSNNNNGEQWITHSPAANDRPPADRTRGRIAAGRPPADRTRAKERARKAARERAR